MARYCLRYKNTRHGRRCAAYGGSGGGMGSIGRAMGALPTNIDTILAPGVGIVSSLGTAAVVARFGSPGSFATRHSGLIGAGAGGAAAVIYGLARGSGAGIMAGIFAGAVGAAIEIFQYVVANRLRAAMAPAGTPALPPAGGGEGGTGFIRAKMLQGLGAQMRRGYRMQGGTSLLEPTTPGVVF